MADFAQAVAVVLEHEGGFVASPPHDPGGATHWGISQQWAFRELGPEWTAERIEALQLSEAVEIYRRYWWAPLNLALLKSQLVATKVLDLTVNVGHSAGSRTLQEACVGCGADILIDGYLGGQTVAAVNSLEELELLFSLASRSLLLYQSFGSYRHHKHLWIPRAHWPWVNRLPSMKRNVT